MWILSLQIDIKLNENWNNLKCPKENQLKVDLIFLNFS
jgi:hypothetical protein